MNLDQSAQGWFVYEEGQVKGPFSIQELASTPPQLLKNRFVSKQGFSRWYPIQQIQGMLQASERLQNTTDQEIQQLNILAQRVLAKFYDPNNSNIHRPQLESHLTQLTLNQNADFNVAPSQTQRSAPEGFAQHVSAVPPFEMFRSSQTPVGSHPVKREAVLNKEMPQPKNTTKTDTSTFTGPVNQKLNFTLPEESPSYRYFINATKMRLGKPRSVWAMVPLFLITATMYQAFWLKSVNNEVSWHSDGMKRNLVHLPFVFSLIPGLHFIFFYFIAMHIKRMESQHNYSRTRIAVVLLFALFPPMAMIYLQSNLNLHWYSHLTEVSQQQKN